MPRRYVSTKDIFQREMARIIRETLPAEGMPHEWQSGCAAACERIARHLADYFAADSATFIREKFHNEIFDYRDGVMHRNVSTKELAECSMRRLDPEHYVPMHKRDQCERPIGLHVRCKTCGGIVKRKDRRQHLGDKHHDGAWAFEYEQVVKCFEKTA